MPQNPPSLLCMSIVNSNTLEYIVHHNLSRRPFNLVHKLSPHAKQCHMQLNRHNLFLSSQGAQALVRSEWRRQNYKDLYGAL